MSKIISFDVSTTFYDVFLLTQFQFPVAIWFFLPDYFITNFLFRKIVKLAYLVKWKDWIVDDASGLLLLEPTDLRLNGWLVSEINGSKLSEKMLGLGR